MVPTDERYDDLWLCLSSIFKVKRVSTERMKAIEWVGKFQIKVIEIIIIFSIDWFSLQLFKELQIVDPYFEGSLENLQVPFFGHLGCF